MKSSCCSNTHAYYTKNGDGFCLPATQSARAPEVPYDVFDANSLKRMATDVGDGFLHKETRARKLAGRLAADYFLYVREKDAGVRAIRPGRHFAGGGGGHR